MKKTSITLLVTVPLLLSSCGKETTEELKVDQARTLQHPDKEVAAPAPAETKSAEVAETPKLEVLPPAATPETVDLVANKVGDLLGEDAKAKLKELDIHKAGKNLEGELGDVVPNLAAKAEALLGEEQGEKVKGLIEGLQNGEGELPAEISQLAEQLKGKTGDVDVAAELEKLKTDENLQNLLQGLLGGDAPKAPEAPAPAPE